jgi:hypothetical protein
VRLGAAQLLQMESVPPTRPSRKPSSSPSGDTGWVRASSRMPSCAV